MHLNDLDHFVLAMGDKATIPAKVLLGNMPATRKVDKPTAADSDGLPGDWSFDATHIFFCVGDGDWRRIAFTAWT